MIYIIYAKASFSTAQRRNNAYSVVTNYLAQPGISSDLFVPAQIASVDTWGYKGWPNALTAECRFRTQATRDNLWTQLIAGMSGNNAPTKGFAERWDQLLDAANPDADTTMYNEASQSWP